MGSPNLKSAVIRHTLARNLRALPADQKLSENQLAQMSGVNQKQINNITNERTGCGIDALDAIGRALQVPAWVLLVPQLHLATASLGEIERGVKSLTLGRP